MSNISTNKKVRFKAGIADIGPGHFKVRGRIRLNGKIVEKREDFLGKKDAARLRREEIKKEIRAGKKQGVISGPLVLAGNDLQQKREYKTFHDLFEFYKKNNESVGLMRYMNAIDRNLGRIPKDQFEEPFVNYLAILKTEPSKRTGKLLAHKTINNYIDAAAMVFGFACSTPVNRKITGVLTNPLAKYPRLDTEHRKRIFVDDEEKRLFDALITLKSPLYWAARFSRKNPIREADLCKLQRANFDREKRWVHYIPHKTRRKKKNKEAFLTLIDDDTIAYWDSLPPDCPWLFPWINDDGTWRQMDNDKDFNDPWHEVLDLPKISDFHWHDLKHCAITWMLTHGFTRDDLKKLGIQFTDECIEIYDQSGPEDVQSRWNARHGLDRDIETQVLSIKVIKFLLAAGYSPDQLRRIGLKADPDIFECNIDDFLSKLQKLVPEPKCENGVKTPTPLAA